MEKLGRFGTLEQILKWIRWFEASISAILDRRRATRIRLRKWSGIM